MTSKKYLVLAALAILALTALLIGMPAYLEGVRSAMDGQRPTGRNTWLTVAFLFGFPAWAWAAVLCYRSRAWAWMLIVTVASYPGVLAFALARFVSLRSLQQRVHQ